MTTLSIGRHPDCDVVLGDPTVSRRHAELSQIGPDLFMAVDQGSTSGSYRFESGGWKRFTSARLRAVDRVRLGAFETTVADLLDKSRRGSSSPSPSPLRDAAAASPRVERDPLTGQIVVRER